MDGAIRGEWRSSGVERNQNPQWYKDSKTIAPHYRLHSCAQFLYCVLFKFYMI